MNYIDLTSLFNRINHNKIVELLIKQIKNEEKYYIYVEAIHYHNNENIDRYLIKSEQSYEITHYYETSFSTLLGLINLERLVIKSICNLKYLPNFNDSIKLKTFICSNNNLLRLPSSLPRSVKYFDCSHNKLTEIPVLHNGIEHVYCNNNNIYHLPLFPQSVFIIYFNINPIKEVYNSTNSQHFKKINRILYNFRYNYYFFKYAKKIFYYFLKKKINRIKNELLLKSAMINMNPKRIERLLKIYEICGNDFDDI
jgi:Leucine-rich repeat (LRR) protein